MSKITSPKLHSEYAKAKEDQGNYAEAEKAYLAAKDIDNVIRLNLEHLKNPEKAFELVRQTRTAVGARLAAKFCQSNKDFGSAIEFMLLAKLPEEAFVLAQVCHHFNLIISNPIIVDTRANGQICRDSWR